MSNDKQSDNGGEMSDSSEETVEQYFFDIISDTEIVYGGFTSPDGITRIKGGDRLVVDEPVVTIVTDRRVMFTTPSKGATGVVALGYEELLSVSIVEGTLELTTAGGVGLEWSLGSGLSGDEDAVAHLRWIGTVRNQYRSCRNDIDLAVGEIRRCRESRSWEEATAVYQQGRDKLDEICNLVFATEGVDQDVLAPDLIEIERRLELAYTRLYLERAYSQLDLGRQLLENGDIVQGRRVLKQTQQYYREAQYRRDAVERRDAFQFGAQRDLNEELQRLGWQIETVAAEPIKQAHEAKVKAQYAEQIDTKLDHWEFAFERYGQVLTLEWGTDERNFAGKPAAVRSALQEAAKRLIELHTERAGTLWADRSSSDRKDALSALLAASEHYERAHELASEFAPDRAEAIADRRDTVEMAVRRLRNEPYNPSTGSTDDADSPQSNTATDDSDSDAVSRRRPPVDTSADDSRPLPTAETLAEMDTHHELTLDVDELAVSDEDEPHRWELLKRETDREHSDSRANGDEDDGEQPDSRANDGKSSRH